MADIVWSDVEAHAPDLSSVSAGAQTDILAQVNTALNVTGFGGESTPKLRLARIYLAAHHATLATIAASGANGPVIAEQAGKLRRQFQQASASIMNTEFYSQTGWGRMFIDLCKSNAVRVGFVV